MPTNLPRSPRLVLAGLAALLASAALAVPLPANFPARVPPPAPPGALPPHPWQPDAFVPVSAARVAALPPDQQPAWRAYLAESARRSALLPARDLVDHSPDQPVHRGMFKASYSRGVRLGAPAAYYASEPARLVADHLVTWQTPAGGWTKSGDYTRAFAPADNHHDAWSGGTFDNDATIFELRYLALVNAAAADSPRSAAWRAAFRRGLDYVLAAQYPNGGFPQVYPLVGWYHDAITFNDDAMVHILVLLRDVAARQAAYAFVPPAQADRARVALQRGIQCVLAAQLRSPDGRLIVWGQQLDPLTLQPCAARNFEPIAACSNESVGLTEFLMSLPHPSPAIVQAVNGAMGWFEETAFHHVGWDRQGNTGNGLVNDAHAPDLWARFYELDTGRPVFGDRDRTIHYAVGEISAERRLGYAWFNTRGASLPGEYAAWKQRLSP